MGPPPESKHARSHLSMLWLVHCMLGWFLTMAALITDVPAIAFAALVVFLSHVMLAGLIFGLLLSDSPGPVRKILE